jgi:hypothetical protein
LVVNGDATEATVRSAIDEAGYEVTDLIGSHVGSVVSRSTATADGGQVAEHSTRTQ